MRTLANNEVALRSPIADRDPIIRYKILVDTRRTADNSSHRGFGTWCKDPRCSDTHRKTTGMDLLKKIRKSLEAQFGYGRVGMGSGTAEDQDKGYTILEVR